MFLKNYMAGAVAAALVTASLGASAADWSLGQMARQALATHPEIVGKQYSLNAAEANVKAAQWQRFPTLAVEGGKANDGNPRFTDVSLTQPIWAGGRISGGIASAEAQKDAASASVDETREDILLRVATAYVEAMRQQARTAIAEKEVEQHQQLFDMISRRVDAQASARVDRDLAQSRLYQADNDLSAAKQALATALSQLSQLVGQRVPSVDDYSIDQTMPDSVDTAVDMATGVSPTLRRYDYQEKAAEADITVKKAAYLPQVSVRFDKFYGQDLITPQDTTRGSRVMLVIQAEPGAGLSAAAGVGAAVAAKNAAIEARTAALRDLRLVVSTDWDEYMGARERFQSSTLSTASSKAVYESYVRQYTIGKKSWLDVMNTVREASQSEMTTADAKAQMTAAALRLEVRTGEAKFLDEASNVPPAQNNSTP